jgi:hypothetical protein
MSITQQDYLDNTGGLSRIYFTPVSNIFQYENIYDGQIHNLVLNTGEMDTLFIVPDSAEFTQEKSQSPAGDVFATSLTAIIPKDRPELLAKCQEMDGKEFIVVYKDNNGYYKVLGSPEEPMKFSADVNTGQRESLNKYTVKFARSLRFRSPFIADIPTSAIA